jgi:hypothetical protein
VMVWPSSPFGNAEDSFTSFGYRYLLPLFVVVEIMGWEVKDLFGCRQSPSCSCCKSVECFRVRISREMTSTALGLLKESCLWALTGLALAGQEEHCCYAHSHIDYTDLHSG